MDRDQITHSCQLLAADAFDQQQVVDFLEWPVGPAVVDDALSQLRADARQARQLAERRAIHVDAGDGCRHQSEPMLPAPPSPREAEPEMTP